MRDIRALGMVVCVLPFAKSGSAHRIDEYLQATLLSLEADRVQASLRLIPGMVVAPSVIAGIDGNGDGMFSEIEKKAYAQRVLGDLSIAIDGMRAQPELVSWSFPEPAQMREGLGEIHIEYRVLFPGGGGDRSFQVSNRHLSGSSVYLMNALVPEDHEIHILAQKRNEQQSAYELDFRQTGNVETGWRSFTGWLNGMQFASLFRLGMRHIAEGTDHLLFLLVLLLPAPLIAARLRESLLHIVSIVTAFTIGHSLTLSLAAFHAVNVPSRAVEVLIAVSILVSAVNAWRPIFPGKEAWIAGFFGLIHGLAFATALDRLGMGRWDRVAGVLAFNLGIETMQMIVVAAILPSLLLMSGTRLYPALRIGGAMFAGLASLGWIVERLFDVATPVDVVVNSVAGHALPLAIGLFMVSLVSRQIRWDGHGVSSL